MHPGRFYSKHIYTFYGRGLGDSWRTLNYVINHIGKPNEIMRVATRQIGDDTHGNPDLKRRLSEIMAVLDTKREVELIDSAGSKIIYPEEMHYTNYSPTKVRWQHGGHGKMCYQFDGVAQSDVKNPPQHDINKMLGYFSSKGFKPIRLDGSRTLKASIDVIANCDFFVGICSGFSHVCHSTGIPMYLLQYGLGDDELDEWHWGKAYTKCMDADDLIDLRENG